MAYGVNAPFGLRPLYSMSGGDWSEKLTEYTIYASDNGTSTYSKSIYTGDPVIWGTSLGATAADNGKVQTIAVYPQTIPDSPANNYPEVPVLGVFMGCEYISSSGNLVKSPFWPGGSRVAPGTPIKASVLDDKDVVYDIQVSVWRDAAASRFVARPYFPDVNTTGATPFALYGGFDRNFALNIGGGTNFNTITNDAGVNLGYANNPANGSVITGQSAFYLDVDASTAITGVSGNVNDYNKTATTLPLKVIGYTDRSDNSPPVGLTIDKTPFINVRVMLNNHAYVGRSAPVAYVA